MTKLFRPARRAVLQLAWTAGLALGMAGVPVAGWAAAPVSPASAMFAPRAAAMPAVPEVAARAFILQDVGSRQTLGERQADQPLPPASLTKLMSAYLVFQALESGKLKSDQALTVSDKAWRAGLNGAVRIAPAPNATLRVDDLIRAMTVLNANDATIALAEGVAGSVDAFVDMMNRQAQSWGLTATRFQNADGTAERQHLSTARDLSYIAARLVLDFPSALPYYAPKSITVEGVPQPNRNLLLLRDPSVDGLQAGYTESGGYAQVATSRRTIAGVERRLISVVLGANSSEARAGESQKLLNWGYSAFDVVKLFDAGQPVTTAKVWKGSSSTVPIGRPEPLIVVVPRGQGKLLKTQLTRPDPLMAPLLKGQNVATLQITLGGQPWQSRPLQALEAVPSAGWLGRVWDAIRLGIQ